MQLNLEEFEWVIKETVQPNGLKLRTSIPFPAPLLAETTAEMRRRAPQMNFAMGVYYPRIDTEEWPELVLAADTVLL